MLEAKAAQHEAMQYSIEAEAAATAAGAGSGRHAEDDEK